MPLGHFRRSESKAKGNGAPEHAQQSKKKSKGSAFWW
jgi:hypothetical protein